MKNKVEPPFREAEFDIIYGEGVSREGDLLDLGATHNVVEKSGSWFSYKGERIGHGRENSRQFLKDNPDIRAVLIQIVQDAGVDEDGGGGSAGSSADTDRYGCAEGGGAGETRSLKINRPGC